uniref:Reverse transcriptase domain-containing protein n=1 Tax=Panagrolaimus davidi TaxID=227884 RepID=A0A914PIU4_9BILA
MSFELVLSSSSSGSDSEESKPQRRNNRDASPRRGRSASRESRSRFRTPTSSVNDEVRGNGNVAPAAPPDLEDAVNKIRVDLSAEELAKHRAFAKGSAPNTRDRESWMDSLPVINDVSGAAPRLEKSVRGRDMKVNLSERQIISIHDDLYAALNLITLANTGNIRGTEEEVKYRDRAQRVISLLIPDVTVIRREAALTSIGLSHATVSGIRKRTLDLVPEKHPSVDNEKVHNLFSANMMEEIAKALKKKEKDKKLETRLVTVCSGRKLVTVTPKSAFMAKMDMKDAYFGVPIKSKYRKYLCFQVNGQMYAFRALPFGLATAPRVYTKVIRPIAAFLRKYGINLIVYLDDWLFLADTAEKLENDLKLASEVLTASGLVINKEKSILTPTQKIEFLGLEIDSSTLCFSVPMSKQEKIKSQAKTLHDNPITKARTVAKFCGLLASIKLASDYSALKARFLQKMLKGVSYKAKGFDCVLSLSPDAIAETVFWLNADAEVFSRRILPPPISMVVRTDASTLGWGCSFNGQKTGGRWSLEEAKLHINVLELRAALFGLQLACKGIKSIGIRLESDNVSAIAYINKRGGTKSRELLAAAQDLWEWALKNRIFVVASHIPGIENIDADAASRRFSENCEWELNQNTVSRLFDKWGKASIDLFASRANKKCEKYYSFQAEPGALAGEDKKFLNRKFHLAA